MTRPIERDVDIANQHATPPSSCRSSTAYVGTYAYLGQPCIVPDMSGRSSPQIAPGGG